MTEVTKYDVFISYSHKDEEWVVGTLLKALETAKLKVCIDFRDFKPGKAAIFNMQDSAKESRFVLLNLTRNWLKSEWSLFEAIIGATKDPAGLQQKIIPLLSEVGIEADVHDFISMRSWVDFTREDRAETAWKMLFTALGKPNAPIPVISDLDDDVTDTLNMDSWFLAHPYPMPANFTGRVDERKNLTDWLNVDKEHPMLILRALGGFGKSALSWYWLTHDVDPNQWPKVVWWSFYEGDASFDNFLKETLVDFGVRNAEQMNPRQQTEILLNLLRNPGILLVLDGFERVLRAYGSMSAAYQGDELDNERNASSRDCINPYADAFLRGIGAFSYLILSKVLMTTRLTPRAVERSGYCIAGVREEELLAMHPDDAVAFFRAQGIRGTRAEIQAACTPYEYHPLSLRILSGYIANDRHQPGDIAVAQRLDVTGDIVQNKHHVLDAAFNSLTASQKKLLGRIACFRAAMSYEVLQSIHGSGQGGPAFDTALETLENRGLLHWDRTSNKYDLHPIVRRYAYERLTGADRTAAHTRLRDYFAAVPEPEKVETLDDLAPVIELYHHMARAGQLDEAIKLYPERLQKTMYYQFGAYQLQIELLRALFVDGEDQPPRLKDESAQAWTLNELANAYSLNGEPRRAVQAFEAVIRIDEKNNDTSPDAATTLMNIADDQLKIGALEQAERNLRRCIKLSREIEEEFNEAVGHQNLGRTLAYCGAWDEAEQELDAAIAIQQKINHVQTEGLSFAYRALRELLLARTEPDSAFQILNSALAHATRALDETKRTRMEVPRDYVRAHWLLGASNRALAAHPELVEGNALEQAEKHLGEALRRCRAINMVDHEAAIMLEVAKLRYSQSESDEALRLAGEALVITERSGYVLQGADVHLFLAELALEGYKLQVTGHMSDQEAAKFHAEKALELATCDGPPYYYKVAYEEAERLLEKLK